MRFSGSFLIINKNNLSSKGDENYIFYLHNLKLCYNKKVKFSI